jgi:hypothetical protein
MHACALPLGAHTPQFQWDYRYGICPISAYAAALTYK